MFEKGNAVVFVRSWDSTCEIGLPADNMDVRIDLVFDQTKTNQVQLKFGYFNANSEKDWIKGLITKSAVDALSLSLSKTSTEAIGNVHTITIPEEFRDVKRYVEKTSTKLEVPGQEKIVSLFQSRVDVYGYTTDGNGILHLVNDRSGDAAVAMWHSYNSVDTPRPVSFVRATKTVSGKPSTPEFGLERGASNFNAIYDKMTAPQQRQGGEGGYYLVGNPPEYLQSYVIKNRGILGLPTIWWTKNYTLVVRSWDRVTFEAILKEIKPRPADKPPPKQDCKFECTFETDQTATYTGAAQAQTVRTGVLKTVVGSVGKNIVGLAMNFEVDNTCTSKMKKGATLTIAADRDQSGELFLFQQRIDLYEFDHAEDFDNRKVQGPPNDGNRTLWANKYRLVMFRKKS